MGPHSTAGNNVIWADFDLEHLPSKVGNEGEGPLAGSLVTSRESLPAEDQTALGAIPIELVRLLTDLLHLLPDLEHLGLEPTLTFLELLDPRDYSRVGNGRHDVRLQRGELLDSEVVGSGTKRYFLSLRFIYLFNCLFIQSTHQVQELAEAEGAESGSE